MILLRFMLFFYKLGLGLSVKAAINAYQPANPLPEMVKFHGYQF